MKCYLDDLKSKDGVNKDINKFRHDCYNRVADQLPDDNNIHNGILLMITWGCHQEADT